MTNELDEKLIQLKALEDKITLITQEKEVMRKEVFELIEKENIDQYKNDVATISKVEKKNIKFVKSEDDILNELKVKNIVKYFDVIPEHAELNKQFDKDVKAGTFSIEGIEIETKEYPMIRFV